MTTCHNPYKELEFYLKEAEDEIGRALRELEEQEETGFLEPESKAKPTDILLPPPQEFRNQNTCEEFESSSLSNSTPSTLKRVCHDGNIVDFRHSFDKLNSVDSNNYPKTRFSSSLSPGTLGRSEKLSYSPNTRRKLWQMHPSLSFPETSKDLLVLGANVTSSSPANHNGILFNGYITNCNGASDESRTFTYSSTHVRQRSRSDTSAPFAMHTEPEDQIHFPRPPSGDVNLLSIWANNLVLELDKTFSSELNSVSSISPSSDYSLSPTKPDDSLNVGNSISNFGGTKSDSVDLSSEQLFNRNLKVVSRSPDSGIEQTLEMTDDCVDSCNYKQKLAINCDFIIPNHCTDQITPPPPEFDDDVLAYDDVFLDSNSQSTKIGNKNPYPWVDILNGAVPICEVPETGEVLENTMHDVGMQECFVAPKTIQLNDYIVVQTTCTVAGMSELEQQPESKSMGSENCLNSKAEYHLVTTLPKSNKVIPNGINKCSSSLPREPGKNEDAAPFYRSVSQSAVSSITDESIEELAAFMQRMKSGLQQVPSRNDVSTDVKEDNENKDAVTQTTPLPLSRSSSFTWVTECDCSDWDSNNLNSGSEDSLFMVHCSNCQKDSKNQKSTSSSSLGISSEDDECPASPGSGSSSLYLSACSGSTDSFEEATTFIQKQLPSSEPIIADEDSKIQSGRRPQRGSETTLRGSTLGDISEEQVTSESISMKSTISNPSLSDVNNIDMAGQSASFPSTLKARRNRSTGSPAQPIEPTVLIINELNLKSVSAPVLRQKRTISKGLESSSSDSSPPTGTRNKDSSNTPGQVPAKSHSAKELNELQAIEACSWLRAAGFPQYAQMYEDNQFPIDIGIVQNDHAFLPPDSIQSLFRRLNTLNRCAKMKFMDHSHRKSLRTEESDEEEQYALSENWEFQRSSRRWSRIPPTSEGILDCIPSDPIASSKPSGNLLPAPSRQYLSPEEAYCSSHNSVFIDEQHSSPDSIRRCSVTKSEKGAMSPTGYVGDCSPGSSSGSGGTISVASEDMLERKNLRRSGSDRVKEGAKAILRRMESLKGKRKKKVENSEVENVVTIQSTTDGSSSSSITSSPQFRRSHRNSGESQKKSDTLHAKTSKPNAHSDPESFVSFTSDKWKDANSNTKYFEQFCTMKTSVTITAPDESPSACEEGRSKFLKFDGKNKKALLHPSSAVQDKENCDNRGSYYDNITAPIVIFNDLCTANLDYSPQHQGDAKSGSTSPVGASSSNQDEEIIIINTERRDSGVGSSLTRGVTYQQAPWHCFPIYPSEMKSLPSSVQVADLTAPQILLLRKLSLLKLTTLMEKYSPTSRTGWSWAVPKLFRRNRSPDYKDKVVFGVPLLMVLQRTGQPLPSSIQAAIHYLRETALEASGLFRKSGVRSRIQKLKSMNESNPEKVSYEDQQAYDVADMLKQYFRELPEALLTNKLSETFISIFQFIPAELRLEAIQAALMLMPDENREVLQTLLEFLHEVCQHSTANQMTATNLAVCFAPSIFHLSTPRSTSSSPRRRKTVGAPDMKELNENRAAYECLSSMISNYKYLFSISDEIVSQSRISSTIHCHPATVEEYSSFVYSDQTGLKSYFDNCIQIFLKEAREKYKGWINVCQYDHVDLSYKKLSDGHPLRIWKVSTEVEAPPVELLNRMLRERHLWDNSFTKWKVVSRINSQTEVFQHLNLSLHPHPPCDYSLLRNWRTDLPKGACILIETSVRCPEAEVTSGCVRALMLASRYLIEPCGAGKSRVTHISRADLRGRSPEWYNRAYGHICIQLLIKLRSSFSRGGTDGPETKV